MCGIAGFVETRGSRSSDALRELVGRMVDVLRHRGPDDQGTWVDARRGVALGHDRLSVIDLSDAGRQPMVSAGSRYVLSYNGEIYNHEALRDQLLAEGYEFRGHSDTEVVLAVVERWGLAEALVRMNGMFAFALWDRDRAELHLARDRLGEKPLYYARMGDAFLFASELKALRAHPSFDPVIDRGALALYLRHNYVPGPHSIYAGVSKLIPGTFLTVRCEGNRPDHDEPKPYWSARDVVESGIAHPLEVADGEAVAQLDRLLRDAVALRMHADVPLGAFLSGGVDSSTVVALMQAQSLRRVKTFTIGFKDSAYDEAADAARVAAHLGTDHAELYVTPDDAMDLIPHLPVFYDEPFADSSQIPTFLVSQLARRDVTVSLSGDGGDELFAGYNRYSWCGPIWRKIRRFPRPVRALAAGALNSLSPDTWESVFRRASGLLPSRLNVRNPGSKVQKVASVLGARSLEGMYLDLVSHWKQPSAVVPGAVEAVSLVTDQAGRARVSDPIEQMMYLDLVTYLPDDILTKVDRASMAVSLEARVPMLDPEVVAFAWRLPLELKLRDGQGKWLLRQVLYRYLPSELVERPKMGFGLPIGRWMRGPLREWGEDLLDDGRLRREGFFDPAAIRRVWSDHLAGDRDRQDELWSVLMFQAWMDEYGRKGPPPAGWR
jgi:asparagine synthase (glutamine-hydrolysing)